MKPLSLALLALSAGLVSTARAQNTSAEVPHRCDLAWIDAALRTMDANSDGRIDANAPAPEGHGRYLEVTLLASGSNRLSISPDQAKREALCDKAVWTYIDGTTRLKAELQTGALNRQLNVLKSADMAFHAADAKALAAFAAADRVIEAAGRLGVINVGQKTLSAQLGLGQAARPRMTDQISAPDITVKAAADVRPPAEGAAELQQSLVRAGANGPEAGPLVQAFHTAVVQWLQAIQGLTTSDRIAKQVLGRRWGGKDLELTFPFPTISGQEPASILAMRPIIAKMVDINATNSGRKYLEDGAQPAAVLSKLDVRLRSALGVSVLRVYEAAQAAANVNPSGRSREERPAGTPVTASVAGGLEARMRQQTLGELGLGEMYDNQNVRAPVDPGPQATDEQRLQFEDQQRAYAKYQQVMSGRVVELRDGTKQFQMQNAPPVDLPAEPNEAQIQAAATRAANLLLEGRPADARLGAAQDALTGGAPIAPALTAGSATGVGAATGLKSGCGDGKTVADYKRELERKRRDRSAGRSADRREALEDYREALQEAEDAYNECAFYPSRRGEQRVKRDDAVVARCEQARTAARNEAAYGRGGTEAAPKGGYYGALAQLGAPEEQAAEDAQIGAQAQTEAERAVRAHILKRRIAAQGAWNGRVQSARINLDSIRPFKYLRTDGQRHWLKDHPRMVNGYFADQWPRAANENPQRPENPPSSPTTRTNLDRCVEIGVRIGNDDDVDDRCLGPMFAAWLDGKIQEGNHYVAPDAAASSDAPNPRALECRRLLQAANGDRAKLPQDCQTLIPAASR